MYNQDLKTEFIRQHTTSINTAKTCSIIFSQTEKYENEWGSDLCTMPKESLQVMFDNIAGIRANSKAACLSLLNEYVKWCMYSKHYPGACDGMLHVDKLGFGKIREQMVVNPVHLQKVLDTVYDDESEHTIDNVYRCFFWLTYSGIRSVDAVNIKCSDVDFSNMVIKYGDTNVPIYRQAIPCLKVCVEETSFVYKHPKYGSSIIRDRFGGDTLMRGIKSQTSIEYIRVESARKIRSKKDETGVRITCDRVRLSGIFYRAYELELAGIQPDFYGAAADDITRKEHKLDRTKATIRSLINKCAKDYLEDYERWKVAFKLQ